MAIEASCIGSAESGTLEQAVTKINVAAYTKYLLKLILYPNVMSWEQPSVSR
jgi:hypothetical protein